MKGKIPLHFIDRLSEEGLGMLLYIASDGFTDNRVSYSTLPAFKVSYILKKFKDVEVKSEYEKLFEELEDSLLEFTK